MSNSQKVNGMLNIFLSKKEHLIYSKINLKGTKNINKNSKNSKKKRIFQLMRYGKKEK